MKNLNNRLYIIGNGFDQHHGQKSGYLDFKKYLEDKDTDLLEKLEKLFTSDSLWGDFEETLAYLDTDQIVDECLNFLFPYSDDDWSDAYHHDYQYEVQRRIDTMTVDLKNLFTEWILQLKLPCDAIEKKIELKKDSAFISFNYTDTLERLYGVAQKNIFYIHNKAIDKESTLILGHSRDPNKIKKLEELYNNEDTDVRVAEGNRILDSYFEDTYKSTNKTIQENNEFFKSLRSVSEIYVLGHSFSKVDIPYFQEIIKYIDKEVTKWKVSIRKRKDIVNREEVFRHLGINISLVEFNSITNVDSKQLKLFNTANF